MLSLYRSRLASALLFLAPVAVSPLAPASDFDVTINEIYYNPFNGFNQDEFIELFNRGGTAVDMSGWAFAEGVQLILPPGTILGPKEYLLVSPDADHARARYGVDAVGNYTGRLDNDGEILSLVNSNGDIISRIHYGDGRNWPSAADGLGASLELVDQHGQTDQARAWAASRLLGGTPGAPNSRSLDPLEVPEVTVLIEQNEIWRFRKGLSAYPADWRQPGFVDAGWDEGPTGIGYGDGDDRTELLDMEDNYLSFAARKSFFLDEETIAELGEVTLEIDYDDAFVAHLNDTEVARRNLGEPLSDVPHDARADTTREAGDPESFLIPPSLFRPGGNVLAVQVHNERLGSSDASFIPRLFSRPFSELDPQGEEPAPVVLNEIRPTEVGSAGFVELFNRSQETQSIGGYRIVDSDGSEFSIPAGTLLPGEHRVFEDGQLGFDVLLAGVTYAILESDAATLVDALDPRPGREGEAGFSFGRFPDGDDDGFVMVEPTPGGANRVEIPGDVLINEIHFHPPFVPPDAECERDCSDRDQWIELHNTDDVVANVGNWSLTKAVRLDVPPDTEIPAGGFLVIASSRDRFLATHSGFDPNLVIGDWQRDLAHDSDTINLRDDLGNLVDHVRYGDGSPRNDEEPDDGVDDETFLGTTWPTDADGSGKTLELIHPLLNNRFGGSWSEGPVGGTPGAVNASFDPSPPVVVDRVIHSPAVPHSAKVVRVTASVSSVGSPISRVEAIWRVDGGGASGIATLRDDGISEDGLPGDGVYAGFIPPQPDRSIVAFRIEARLADGRTTIAPEAPPVPPYDTFDGPFFLYQVIDSRPPANPSPNYYLVMTQADQRELESRSVFSNVLLYGTFIGLPRPGVETVHHLVGVRYRGSQTRDDTPRPYRVEFAAENTFQDMERLNLNATNVGRELLSTDLFGRAGMPAPQAWIANFTFQGTTRTQYVRKERVDRDFLERFFGAASDDGNLYRGLNPPGSDPFPYQADLSYLGADPETYRPYYLKRTNREEDDFTDLVELTRLFDPAETPGAVFADRLEELADVRQWARFFALQACIANEDGGIHSNSGEDYFLYRVPESSRRADAGKWVLIAWDIEESYEDSDERLFRPSLAAVERFLTHPRFARLYYANLVNLRSGIFNRRESRLRLRLIEFLFSFGTIDDIDTFIANRVGFLDENIPASLSAGAGRVPGQPLISAGDTWRYFKGMDEPSGGTLEWTAETFNDAAWPEGASGFGYGDGDDETFLDDMEGEYTTLYIRREFFVADPQELSGLELTIDYDDGFVAFINGTEVLRRELGPPGRRVPFDAVTLGGHEAGEAEINDLSAFLDLLHPGTNVLAIHGVNADIDSSDFSLIPELSESSRNAGAAGCGELILATSDTIGLSGRANAAATDVVRVNGQAVDYDPVSASWTAAVAAPVGESTVTIEAFDVLGIPLDTLEVVVRRISGNFTQVEGTLGGNTTWTAGGGPYLLNGDVVVPSGSTLTIQPGTVVLGGDGSSIIVEGRMVSSGTESDPVLFRPLDCDNRFGGIAVDGAGVGPGDPTSTLRFTSFEHGDRPSGFDGCVAPVNSKILIDSCEFRSIAANAVDGTDSQVEVRDSLFERIFEGIHCTRSDVVVVGSTFRTMIGDKDAIDFDLNGAGRSLIEGCLFVDSSDDGIDLLDATVDIRDNAFVNIQDKALSLEGNGPLGPPTVSGNIILDCGTAIALKNGVTIEDGEHNTLAGNVEGVSLYAKAGFSDGGHGTFHSMIMWANTFDVTLDSRSTVSFTYSDISEAVWPGVGNLSTDPRFTNSGGNEVALAPDSPCIGAGRDGTDMGAVPFTGAPRPFVRADADGNGAINLTDAVVTLGYLFRGDPGGSCLDRFDSNDDGVVDISDPVRILLYLFGPAGPPPAPFPGPGGDPTPDGLTCF